jgi:hypothetical protein
MCFLDIDDATPRFIIRIHSIELFKLITTLFKEVQLSTEKW